MAAGVRAADVRAAASSIASGRPSSRVQISTIASSAASSARARRTNSSTAASTASGASGTSCSPDKRSAAWLVTSTVTPGARREQVRHHRRGVQELLEVVQDEQQLGAGIVHHELHLQPLARVDRGERDEARAVARTRAASRCGQLEREPRLARHRPDR